METAWALAGLTLLLILLGEVSLRGVFWLKDRGRPRVPPDPRVLAAIEDSAAWLPMHYREIEALSDRWEPYVYFRQRPFQGETINVDERGMRATWHSPGGGIADRARTRRLKLLMLGGSSLWGYGARDHATIPSRIARRLHEKGMAVEVRNLAEIGHVSTQELVALIRELQQGYRPDLVLLYDGANDTTAALLEREAGVTTNERNRAREFNLLQSPSRLTVALATRLVRDSGWYRLALAMSRRLLGPPDPAAGLPGEGELPGLAEEVIRRYAANVKLIEALGREYGFRPLFVWQPVVFQKQTLLPFEHEEREKVGWAKAMFQLVHEALERNTDLKSDPAFCDLSGIFRQTESLVFLDHCHTTEAANERIAEALLPRILALLPATEE
jgi:hypothetical protein